MAGALRKGRMWRVQVWQDAAQWRGWQLAAEGAGAAAYPHLLRLPPSVLAGALASMPSGAALRPKVHCRQPTEPPTEQPTELTLRCLPSSPSGTSDTTDMFCLHAQ